MGEWEQSGERTFQKILEWEQSMERKAMEWEWSRERVSHKIGLSAEQQIGCSCSTYMLWG